MMEAIRSSETSVLTRATRRHIPEDVILHSHLREDLKSYAGHKLFRIVRGDTYVEETFFLLLKGDFLNENVPSHTSLPSKRILTGSEFRQCQP
jgi:hypothetical protein